MKRGTPVCRSIPAASARQLPDAVPFDVATGLNYAYGTTLYGLKHRGRLQSGETMLVLGAGGAVGLSAVELGKLMRAFVEARVKPYYLHHGDLAPGTGHFRTTVEEGRGLMRALRGRYSGLCQPAYMLDIPGGHGKVPVGPSYTLHSTKYLLASVIPYALLAPLAHGQTHNPSRLRVALLPDENAATLIQNAQRHVPTSTSPPSATPMRFSIARMTMCAGCCQSAVVRAYRGSRPYQASFVMLRSTSAPARRKAREPCG